MHYIDHYLARLGHAGHTGLLRSPKSYNLLNEVKGPAKAPIPPTAYDAIVSQLYLALDFSISIEC